MTNVMNGSVPATWPRLRRWWRRRTIQPTGHWFALQRVSNATVDDDPTILRWAVDQTTAGLKHQLEWLGLEPVGDIQYTVHGDNFDPNGDALLRAEVEYHKR